VLADSFAYAKKYQHSRDDIKYNGSSPLMPEILSYGHFVAATSSPVGIHLAKVTACGNEIARPETMSVGCERDVARCAWCGMVHV
jgi:hypothetical protein